MGIVVAKRVKVGVGGMEAKPKVIGGRIGASLPKGGRGARPR
jgi:hypothetical protein